MSNRWLTSLLLATSISMSFAPAVAEAKRVAPWPAAAVQVQRRAKVRHELEAARRQQLARLRAYRKARVFPLQQGPGFVSVFKDSEGHLCAMADLIARSGHADLVDETARINNSLRLADVDSGPLMVWMLGSGLTIEEIAFIQMPYAGPLATPAQRVAETARLHRHLVDVERRLRRDWKRSLDVAVERKLAAVIGCTAFPG
jgi:hypothetical protein